MVREIKDRDKLCRVLCPVCLTHSTYETYTINDELILVCTRCRAIKFTKQKGRSRRE